VRGGAASRISPHTLMRRFGHADSGIYAEVIAGGSIAPAMT
jgi:hypothetical protein